MLQTVELSTDQSPALFNDYTIKLLGLDICANTLIGDPMRRGVSGGQKKRVTTGEMLVGPAKAFFMDEISTGLDSSTTFQLTKTLQQIAHLMNSTIIVSLLQPAPETYGLFDDVILMAEGRIVYQGPCANVMEFMAYMGFKCPERKAIADFLQEVTSRKDQRQYWGNKGVPYQYVSVPTFVEGFKQFHVGQTVARELSVPYDRSKSHPAALVHDKYALSTVELLKACFAREVILMRRNFHTYIIKVLQIGFVGSIAATLYLRTTLHHDSINDATVYEGALFFGLIFIMLAGLPELSFTTMRLPVYYKEKELFLYPSWAISIPMFVLRIPWSILEAGIYVCVVYFVIGFSPEPGRFFRLFLVLILINQATIGMFRFAAVAARVKVAAENLGSILFSSSILLGGFVLSRNNMHVWWKWASWCSVVFYAQEASDVNEYLSKEWRKPYDGTTLGIETIRSRGLETRGYWVWLSIGALTGFTILYFVLFTLALHFINPPTVVRKSSEKAREASVAESARTSARTSRQTSTRESLSRQTSVRGSLARQASVRGSLSRRSGLREVMEIHSPGAHLSSSPKLGHSKSVSSSLGSMSQRLAKGVQEIMSPARKSGYENVDSDRDNDMFSTGLSKPIDPELKLSASFDEKTVPGWYDIDRIPDGARGMVLPFQPLCISFENINYYVDMPETMKQRGAVGDKLQLLSDVTAAFRPGVLTALVGESGAGKTTLMDVLAGRKTRGYIEGEIFISGYPKRQETFNRVVGYCEQNDIHSPNITVYESLVFSAWLRLAPEVEKQTRMAFVEEVMELVELDDLQDFVVGLPGQSGLSTEQRKRLTIAVELVANPSIIFMDEPTSGLDARAAAIVMRAVRNIGDTGRTIVCTIHQPSIDIFEAFDELLLLKRGGKTIYAGPLGQQSRDLVEYFEAVSGVPKIKEGQNPAAWMLEITSVSMESKLGVNFAEIYSNSRTSKKNVAMIRKLRTPAPGSKDLDFSTVYAQSFGVQTHACFWKMGMSYWRNPLYTGVKTVFVTFMGLLIGSMFWNLGKKRATEQDIFNLMGIFYCLVMFVGFGFTMAVQPIIATERLVYYRERGAGLYSPLTYAVAQFVIEWPYVFANTVLFTAIAYSMIEFDWDVGKVIWFWFFSCFTCLFFVHWGMIAVSATSNPQFAAILGTFPFSLFSLFSGFPITRRQMPVWWRWLYWLNPTAWSLYGFCGSQLGDVTTTVAVPDDPGQTITVKDFIRSYYGYEHSFLKYIAIEQIGLVLTLGVVFALCIKYLNFQRR